jgi:eukaryotic-like serine/threonine-protein kinase
MDNGPFYKQLTLLDVKSHKEDVLPEKIGPYVIEALIAKSHYSIIYLGYNPDTRQICALKVLSPEFVEKKAMVSSFINEGSIIQMASHPNIVKLYAQGKWEGGLYLAMEFIRGVSLRQFIQQHSLSLKRCLDIVLQVCYALCHLHAHGIIHGDLKPENILIAEDGEVKVLDFGIAKIQSITPTHMSLAGTPSYMSPEHKISVHNLTFSSDIYSLGVIAYELITGKLSFGVIHLDQIPKNLRHIIEKCLNKSLDERYQDVVDLIYDLSQFFKKELIDQKISDDTKSSLEIDISQSLIEKFPLPKLYVDPLDFGFARNITKKAHPFLAHIFKDGSLLLALFQAKSSSLKAGLDESMALGFMKFYIQNHMSKNFQMSHFCSEINKICFETNVHLEFSFVHVGNFIDEIHICHGGLLPPLMSKNQQIFTPPVTVTNKLLGQNLDELSISSHSLDIGDQFLIHNLKNQEQLDSLIKHYSSISSYSAQILSDAIIKKSISLDLASVITCLKVK